MIHLHVHGWSWGVAYWMIMVAIGTILKVSNLRHAWRQIRATRESKPAVHAGAVGHLRMHLGVGVFLVVVGLIGLYLLVGAWLGSLDLQFANTSSAVLFIGVALFVASLPSGFAILFWLWRWQTLHAA